jgi:hypothetical protein
MTPVNLMNYRAERTEDGTDWIMYGDITDNNNQVLASFGEDGTSLNQWWVRQDSNFQQTYVNMFAGIMASEIVNGTAE